MLDSSKRFLDIWATIECRSTLRLVHDMIKTNSQKRRTDMYPEHSSIIWPVGLNDLVLGYELSFLRFESSCSQFELCSIKLYIGMAKSKSSASSIVVISILVIHLVHGAKLVNATFISGAAMTVVSAFTRM